MPNAPFLRPTTLQQLRTFLGQAGAPLAPWTSFDEVLNHLVALVHARRDDPRFFAQLSPFLEELRVNAARGEAGLAAPDAELLGRATVESIVSELREKLRGAPERASPSTLRALLAEGAAPLLFLALLTTAVTGCTQSETSPTGVSDRSGTAAPLPAPPTPAAIPADASVTTDAMVEMFRQKSPQEAAAWLEGMVDAGMKKFSRPVPLYKGVSL
jgi:hypothetical protein